MLSKTIRPLHNRAVCGIDVMLFMLFLQLALDTSILKADLEISR